jgi:hypothetical protein
VGNVKVSPNRASAVVEKAVRRGDVSATAAGLRSSVDLAEAIRFVRLELQRARRARSRRRYGFWAAVGGQIDAGKLDSAAAGLNMTRIRDIKNCVGAVAADR